MQPLVRKAGFQRALGQQRDHRAGGAASSVGPLAEDQVVEHPRGDRAHFQDVLVAPVAGNADHADHPAHGRAQPLDQVAHGAHGAGVVRVVDDDPEAMGVVDVEPARIVGVRGVEGAQGLGDLRRAGAQAMAGGDGRQGVGDVELGQAPQGGGDLVAMHDEGALALVVDHQIAAAHRRLARHQQAAFGDVLLQEGRHLRPAFSVK
jgi:hypothetical protein